MSKDRKGWKFSINFCPSITLFLNLIIYLIAIILMIVAIKNSSYFIGMLSVLIAAFEIEISIDGKEI